MKNINIYDLQKIDNIREILPREDRDFTPWLADELYKINDVLGLDLELLEIEATCGKYKLDIKAKNRRDDSIAVIENQYGYTDHDHLGKLITYASGFDAKYMIWITESYNDEHRAAIDWLNEISHEDTSFFLIQVELVRINNSQDVASNFKVICKPNHWSKMIKEKISGRNSARGLFFMNFWDDLKEYAKSSQHLLAEKMGKSLANSFNNVSIKSKRCLITLESSSAKTSVCLYIHNDRGLFDYLYSLKDEIHKEMGVELYWDESENTKKFEVAMVNDSLKANIGDVKTYEWILESFDKLYHVMPKYVQDYENNILNK